MLNKAKDMFQFMDLDMQETTTKFIQKATHPEPGQELPHNVHIRDPKTVISKWTKNLKVDEIEKIENVCKEAMELWKYPLYENVDDLDNMYKKAFNIKVN